MKVIYEDNHIIVVYKKYGILSQKDNSNNDNLLDEIKKYLKVKYNKPGEVYLGLVHRLDRNTEGIMVFARTSKAAKRLSEAIKNGEFKKKYYAAVEGIVPEKGRLENYLAKDEKEKKAYESKIGKYASLDYERILVKKYNEQDISICDIKLNTGRFHQIRCQFSLMGYPLVGDIKYGSKLKLNEPFLQAYSLSFIHPTTRENLEFCEIDYKGLFEGLENAIRNEN